MEVVEDPVAAPRMKLGACHRCSGEIKDESKAHKCETCKCRYHAHDCGKRIANAGHAAEDCAKCPRCEAICTCKGGLVLCHSGKQRMIREKKKEGGDASSGEKKKRPREASPAVIAAKMSRVETNAVAALLKCAPSFTGGKTNEEVASAAEAAAAMFCKSLWDVVLGSESE